MTPSEFKAIRVSMNLSQAELATLLGYAHASRVGALESAASGKPVPPLLERLMRAYEAGYRPQTVRPSGGLAFDGPPSEPASARSR